MTDNEKEVLKELNNAATHNWLSDIKIYINGNIFLSTKEDAMRTAVNTAIYKNNIDASKILLSRGLFSSSALSEFLHDCISRGQLNMIEYLIKMGANVHSKTCSVTPLSHAVNRENIKVIEFLLNNGAQFTIHSALLTAVRNNNLDIIELLLQKGADPNFQNEEGLTPLIQALNNRTVKSDIVEKLIKNGADVNISTPKGTPLIDDIIKTQHPKIIAIIFQNLADVNLSTPNGTPLIIAINTGVPEIVDIIVRNQADVNRSDENGNYPILLAMEKRNNEIVNILMENNAKLNIVDKNGDTLFMKAVRLSNREVIKYLIEHGEDVNQKDQNGLCALSVALCEDDFSTFDLLIQLGANPDLAAESIQAKATENSDFAHYVLEMNKKRNEKGLSGQEASK